MNNINNTIIEYLQKEKYSNLSYNYIDEENKLVIVGLIDNSKTAQEWFNKNIINSKYILFEKSRKLENDDFISKRINTIVNDGRVNTSSNPFDYINANKREYYELLKYPKETFEYAIKGLIETNGNNGLKGYIEALLCSEINTNFVYDFESSSDYLRKYKEFLTKDNIEFNEYDKYTMNLIKGKTI